MTRSDCAVVLVSAPVVALAVGWLAMLALASNGVHPIWDLQPRNLAEAAAFRDGGAIVRRVWSGDDPSAPGEVRPGFISRMPVTLTPIEAAVQARRSEIVRLLLDAGARLDALSWTRVWCGADDADIRTILAPYRPQGTASQCGESSQRP